MDTSNERIKFLEEDLKNTLEERDKAKAQASWTGFCLVFITLIGFLVMVKPGWFIPSCEFLLCQLCKEGFGNW